MIREFFKRPKLIYRFKKQFHILRLKIQTRRFNKAFRKGVGRETNRYLYASPVSAQGKERLRKVIKRFGTDKFDYLIFVYDDSSFNEPEFECCRIIHQKGNHWELMQRFFSPEDCLEYDYIFAWPDDIDMLKFNPFRFVEIMKINNLQVAQPALSSGSYISWEITKLNSKYKIGRYTDFVEIMAPVFTSNAWISFHKMMEDNDSPKGWGYDIVARKVCGYMNIGIIDEQPVKHVNPLDGDRAKWEVQSKRLLNCYPSYYQAYKVSYGRLKG